MRVISMPGRARRATALLVGLFAVLSFAAVPVAADDAGADPVRIDVKALPGAMTDTAAVNLKSLQGQASQSGNTSCRVDPPAFVSQPEVDGRVIVRGEDTGAGTAECVDIQLNATSVISGELWAEWQVSPGVWLVVEATRTPVSGRMIKGVGAGTGAFDYIYPPNHESQGKPHRACLRLDAPQAFSKICSLAVPSVAATI